MRLSRIAGVAVNNATLFFDRIYSYLIPPELEPLVGVGSMVLVPFGYRSQKARMGVVLSVVNFGRIMLFEGVGTMVALTVSLSLFVTVVVAKCIGCALPIVARRCGFDPAVMASPFITTIVDAISLVVFFNVATNLLHLAA